MRTGTAPRRRLRALQWLLILAAVLLLILLIRSLRQASESAEETAWRPPLRKGEGASVVAIHLLRDPHPLRMRREGRSWWLREPLVDLANTRTVRELFRALESLEIRRQLPEGNLARYGLDPPVALLTLSFADGSKREMRVGDPAPVSGDTYVTWQGLPGVALVPRFVIARFFQSDLFSWRETEMLPPAPAAIDSVWVLLPNERVRMMREGAERWHFREPADREADGLVCERAVAAFWRFAFLRFCDDPARRAAIEAAPPLARWVIFRGGEVDTLRIGARLPDDTMIVQHSARAPGLCDARLHDLLTGGAAVLEVRRLLRGSADEISQVLVVAPEGHRHFWRAGARWQSGSLGPAALEQAESGRPPREAERHRAGEADATLAGELRNLFWLQGETWLPELDTAPELQDYPLRFHLWDEAGSHQWAFFRPAQAPGSSWGMLPREFSGVALGAREPRRPMRLRADVVNRWALRARPDSSQDRR